MDSMYIFQYTQELELELITSAEQTEYSGTYIL